MYLDKLENYWLLLVAHLGRIIGMLPFSIKNIESESRDMDVMPSDRKVRNVNQNENLSLTPRKWCLQYNSNFLPWSYINCLVVIAGCYLYYIKMVEEIVVKVVMTASIACLHTSTFLGPFQISRYYHYFSTFNKLHRKQVHLYKKVLVFDISFCLITLVWCFALSMVLLSTTTISSKMYNILFMVSFTNLYVGAYAKVLFIRGSCVILTNEILRIKTEFAKKDYRLDVIADHIKKVCLLMQ